MCSELQFRAGVDFYWKAMNMHLEQLILQYMFQYTTYIRVQKQDFGILPVQVEKIRDLSFSNKEPKSESNKFLG